jgi:hypothetical protein
MCRPRNLLRRCWWTFRCLRSTKVRLLYGRKLREGILKNAKRELGDDDLSEKNLETLVGFEDLVDTTSEGVELSVEDVLPELPELAKRDLGDLNFALGDGLPELQTIGEREGDTSAVAAGSFLAPVALFVLLRNLIPGGAGRIHPRQFR